MLLRVLVPAHMGCHGQSGVNDRNIRTKTKTKTRGAFVIEYDHLNVNIIVLHKPIFRHFSVFYFRQKICIIFTYVHVLNTMFVDDCFDLVITHWSWSLKLNYTGPG